MQAPNQIQAEAHEQEVLLRRPLKSRGANWARLFASWLSKQSVTPNQISVTSVFFAGIGGAAMLKGFYFLAAVCVQLRLLCNLMDGMVAVEGGKKTASGELYNEIPDRFSDVIFLVCFGYASGLPALGWSAAVLAILTAYVRSLACFIGAPADFRGPMAKPHRMALITVTLIACSIVSNFSGELVQPIMLAALIVLNLGAALTIYRRTRATYVWLEKRGALK